MVCLDEKPVVLHAGIPGSSAPIGPGRVARRDYEYRRCGTTKVFRAVDREGGTALHQIDAHAQVARVRRLPPGDRRRLSRGRHHDLVIDNLSTHNRKAVVDCFGEKAGDRLWRRFTVHHTPRHGSWLNQADIEIKRTFTRKSGAETKVRNHAVGILVTLKLHEGTLVGEQPDVYDVGAPFRASPCAAFETSSQASHVAIRSAYVARALGRSVEPIASRRGGFCASTTLRMASDVA